MRKIIPLLIVITLIFTSCQTVGSPDYSINFVPVEYDGVQAILNEGHYAAYTSVESEYSVITSYVTTLDEIIAFNVFIGNLSDSNIRIYESDIEVFSGSIEEGGWKSYGTWSFKDYIDYMDDRSDYFFWFGFRGEQTLYDSLIGDMMDASFRSNDIFPDDTYIGKIFYPFEYKDYAIVITMPDGNKITNYYKIDKAI